TTRLRLAAVRILHALDLTTLLGMRSLYVQLFSVRTYIHCGGPAAVRLRIGPATRHRGFTFAFIQRDGGVQINLSLLLLLSIRQRGVDACGCDRGGYHNSLRALEQGGLPIWPRTLRGLRRPI